MFENVGGCTDGHLLESHLCELIIAKLQIKQYSMNNLDIQIMIRLHKRLADVYKDSRHEHAVPFRKK